MGARIAGVCVLCVALLGGGPSTADDVGSELVVVALRDGSRLVGTVVAEDEATVTFRTTSGLELKLARADIDSRGPVPPAAGAGGPDSTKPELSDPNDTRLMFAPTGRPLRKGDGYFSDHYVIFPGFAYGVTDNVSVSGGVSIVPGLGLDEQALYVSSSVGWRLSKKAAFSLGGLFATGTETSEAGAMLFGVGELRLERSLPEPRARPRRDPGGGVLLRRQRGTTCAAESCWSFRDAPVLMVGGTFRVGKRLSLVTESWLFLGDDFALSRAAVRGGPAVLRRAPLRGRGPCPRRRDPGRGLPDSVAFVRLPFRPLAERGQSTSDGRVPSVPRAGARAIAERGMAVPEPG